MLRWAEQFCNWIAAFVWFVLAFLSLLLLARPAQAVGLEVTTVANLPACENGSPWVILVVDGASATDCATGASTTEVVCTCKDGVIAGLSTSGGSGDITDVWGCTSGNCNAITAASGDSLDAGSADASSPATRSTSLPGTCSEGQIHQDTDSGATETYICTASNTWTKLGQGVILDLADDGSNEASNMGEFATSNDDYAAVTEPSDAKALINFGLIPPYRQYDINRPPTSCANCDEFTGDAASLTWAWGNQGTSTITYQQDAAFLDIPAGAGENLRVRWITGADGSATDWVATMKVGIQIKASFNSISLSLLYSGTEATPTAIRNCAMVADATTLDAYDLISSTHTNYTTFSANQTSLDSGFSGTGPFYVRMRYVSSTKGLTCGWSNDGLMWYEAATQTLAAHPTTSIGFLANAANASVFPQLVVFWFRQRTDATGTASPYPAGS